MINCVSNFNLTSFLLTPWIEGQARDSFWIVLMGFLVASTCGLVGKFIILRRLALMGDALSHSILPGIVIAFLITASRGIIPMVIGALLAGFLANFIIGSITKHTSIQTDAAIGVTFSVLFSIGVVLTALFADKIDLDQDCILYGELAFIPYAPHYKLGFISVPWPILRIFGVFMFIVGAIFLFYKELVLTAFDAGLARCLGIKNNYFYYGLMALVSLAIVSCFEAVGAILVIAMLIFPGATASLLSERLKVILWLSVGLSFLYAILGLHIGFWLDCSIGAAMVLAAGACLFLTWIKYVIAKRIKPIS